MADRKVEIVLKCFDAWNSGNFQGDVEDIDTAVEVDWSETNAPYAGSYFGHDGWRRLFAELAEGFNGASAEIHECVVVGPHVAVDNTGHLRGRGGVEVVARSTIVFTFRDDKIVAARLYQKHADALAAIGTEGHPN